MNCRCYSNLHNYCNWAVRCTRMLKFFNADRWRPKELRIWFMWKTQTEYRRRQKNCLLLMKMSNHLQNRNCHEEKGKNRRYSQKTWHHAKKVHIYWLLLLLLIYNIIIIVIVVGQRLISLLLRYVHINHSSYSFDLIMYVHSDGVSNNLRTWELLLVFCV